MPVTNTFVDGSVISAAELNTNFQDVLNETSGITAADLHSQAGIISTQIADRYAISTETVNLLGSFLSDGGAAGVAAVYTFPNSTASPGTEVWRKIMTLRTGKAAYLVGVSVYAQTIAGSEQAVIFVGHNGVVLGGGGARIDAADTAYHLRNTNPIDNPLVALANDDFITIGIAVDASASNVVINGLTITLTYKIELSA